jgi:RNase P protein component
VKRRMREAVRSLYPRLRPSHDLVFIARPAAVTASAADLAAAIRSLAQRAGLLARDASPGGDAGATANGQNRRAAHGQAEP